MKLFQSLNGSQGGFSIWMLIWTLLFLASLSIMALCFAQAAQINQTYADLRDQSSALSFNFVQVEDNLDEAIDGDLFAAGQVSQASDAIETIVGTFANGDSFNNQDALDTELVPIFPEIRTLWDESRAITEGFVEESRSFGDAKDLVENILDVVPELTFFVSQMNNSAKIENLGQVEGVVPIVNNIVVQTGVVSDGLRVLADEGGVAASLATSKSRDGLALIRNDLLNLLDKPEVYDFPDFINALTEANAIISTIEDQIDEISDISLINSRTIEGASTVSDANGRIRSLIPNLEAQLDNGYNTSEESTNLAYIFAALALVSFLGLLATIYIRTRRQLKITQESSNKNERAILRLLDEMATLAEGDLTVQATVTEDMTGAIADAVNYAIEALRSLVTTINSTSGHVSVAAEKTRSTALKLASASDRQAKQIVSATRSVNEMTTSIETVSKGAQDSAKVAEKAVSIAKKGVETVQRTIDGMDVIRQQIQDTSKRIKRLGESSQEIGEIVRLINDIADQTNILALNAAIQASSAGEAGRGFAVVADEVQRLAERSANATKQIEALVKTIQADTNEAVSSMELSTANVVKGTQNARDAGDALSEVEGVSNELAKLISEISNAAKEQALASVGIANTMNSIREVTVQTSTGTNETAQSIGNLAEMAGDLRQSVDGFKLPEEDLSLDIEEMVEAIEEEEPIMIDSVVG